MGNESSSPSKYERFQPNDWTLVQENSDFKVWSSKKHPQENIEQHDTNHQMKIFELRRRNPLLVAAYYLESHPKQQLCSFYSQHTLFLERIPLRLCDIEHVPYPDHLHLYDACLKGFAQLARTVGYFLVNQAMIGINERGIAKAWLNQDFAKSSPLPLKTSQQNMVRSIIDSINRSIDLETLPPSVSSVENFIYQHSGSINFDTSIWSLGQFIRNFNGSQIPIKLDCIDRVGGIYAIANRQKSQKLLRSSVSNRQIGKSGVISNRLQKSTSNIKLNAERSMNSQIINKNLKWVKSESQIKPIVVQERKNIIYNVANIPRGSQVTNLPPYQHPLKIVQPLNNPHVILLNNPPQIQHFQFQPQNHQVIGSQIINKSVVIAPNSEQKVIAPTPLRNSQQISQQMIVNPLQGSRIESKVSPRGTTRFTVQVVPGKVIPQKSSTIFKQSSSKVVPQDVSEKKIMLLEQNNPTITTSQKYVEVAQESKVHQDIIIPQYQQAQAQDQIIEHQEVPHAQQPLHMHQEPYIAQPSIQINDTQQHHYEDQYDLKQDQELAIQSNQLVQNDLLISFNPARNKHSVNNFEEPALSAQQVNEKQNYLQNYNYGVTQITTEVLNNYQPVAQVKEYNYDYYQRPFQGQSLDYNSYIPKSYNYDISSKLQQEGEDFSHQFYSGYSHYQNYSNTNAFNKVQHTFQEPQSNLKGLDTNYNYYSSTTNPITSTKYYTQTNQNNSYKFISQSSAFDDISGKKSLDNFTSSAKESMNPSKYSQYLTSLVSHPNQTTNEFGSYKSIIDSVGKDKFELTSYGYNRQTTTEYV